MRDCSNAEMRDRLPELLYGQLRDAELAAVRAHVAGCVDCHAELALLEQVRAALLTPASPAIDTARVVAALPRYRAIPAWRRALQSAQLRAAAAVVLLIGGYALVARPGANGRIDTQRVAVVAPANELAIGDSFQDLSDSDLAAVLEALGKLEAVTPDASEELVLPVVTRAPGGGGGSS